MSAEITQLLDDAANIQAQLDALRLQKQAEIDKIITPEIKVQLEALDAEYGDKADVAEDKLAALKEQLKALVIANGATVKGEFIQAVYCKPRVTWNSKALEGYAMAHPEILDARKIGKPSVRFRNV